MEKISKSILHGFTELRLGVRLGLRIGLRVRARAIEGCHQWVGFLPVTWLTFQLTNHPGAAPGTDRKPSCESWQPSSSGSVWIASGDPEGAKGVLGGEGCPMAVGHFCRYRLCTPCRSIRATICCPLSNPSRGSSSVVLGGWKR